MGSGRPTAPRLAALAAEYSGPLPPPAMLLEYERAAPGLADKIITAFQSEGDHRREAERRMLALQERMASAEVDATKLGMLLAFGIVVIFAAVAAFAIHQGHPVTGAVILGADLAAVVVTFIVGRRAQVQEAKTLPEHQEQHPPT